MDALHTDLARLQCRQFKDGTWRTFADEAAREISVTLTVEGQGVKKLWAFPGSLLELAVGHSLLDLAPPGTLAAVTEEAPTAFSVRFVPGAPPEGLPWPGPLTAQDIRQAAAAFMDMAGRWDSTGCFHRAALFDVRAKSFTRHVEDIGRHNCLDRLAGWALGAGVALKGQALFVTARATASLVGKAVRSGYALMVSRSAVTTAGVELARNAGMSLVGFSRENRFSIFTDDNARLETRS